MLSSASGSNELLDLFTRYNNDLWPIHILAYATSIAAVLGAQHLGRPAVRCAPQHRAESTERVSRTYWH